MSSDEVNATTTFVLGEERVKDSCGRRPRLKKFKDGRKSRLKGGKTPSRLPETNGHATALSWLMTGPSLWTVAELEAQYGGTSDEDKGKDHQSNYGEHRRDL